MAEFNYGGETLHTGIAGQFVTGEPVRVVLDANGEQYARLSVNLGELPDPTRPDVFWLKDYAENEWLVDTMERAGVLVYAMDVEPRRSGFVLIPAARIVG